MYLWIYLFYEFIYYNYYIISKRIIIIFFFTKFFFYVTFKKQIQINQDKQQKSAKVNQMY